MIHFSSGIKYQFINCVFLFLITSLSGADRPNIIFLFADDQRADTIAAHGNPHIKTPNLDQMAKEGMSFRNNFCAGSYSGAVCVASRAMLMTGKYWMNLSSKKNWSEKNLLPAYLKKEAGYETFIVGKWHNGLTNLRNSFSNGRSVYMGGMNDHSDFEVQDYVNGQLGEKHKAKEFSSAEFATEAINYIKSAKKDNPFFLYVAFMAPHDPRNPPEKYREMYYKNRPPLPKNYLPYHPFKNTNITTAGRDEGLAAWPRTEEVISDQLCEYYGLVTHLDEQVGRIIKALEKSPHADNTIIVYTADHGLAMGSHGLLGKQNVYEQSMKCPLIITGPKIPKSTESFAYTHIHDLYATLCSYAGITVPKEVDAKDLKPIMDGKQTVVRESLFLPFQDSQRSITEGDFKLHIYPKINHQLLFNIKEDPEEMNDLSKDARYHNRIVQLTEEMNHWRTELGDAQPLMSKKPEPKEVDYTQINRVLDKWQPKWIVDKYFDGITEPTHGIKK